MDELAVTLDGAKVPLPLLGVPVDVDPGEHVIEATAKGRPPIHLSVRVADGETRTVGLSFGTSNTPTPTPRPETTGRSPTPPSRLPPLLVAGVGALGVAAGLGFGWVAIEKRKEACGTEKYCEPEGFARGKTFADVSTVVTAAGGATLVAGALWFFLTPSRRSHRTTAVAPIANPNFVGLHATSSF
jgi:hypothetical protein